MKISNKKSLFKIIISLFLFPPCIAQAEFSAWHQKPLWYEKAKKVVHLVHHALMHKADELDNMLADIDKQFEEFNVWMIAQERKALNAIREKYAIHDTLWQKCLHDIENIKATHTASFLHPHPQIVHDQSIPADIKGILFAFMKNNRMHPESINLVMADEAKIKAKPNTVAETTIAVDIFIDQNELVFKLVDNPTKITLFPRIMHASSEKKIITFAHELQHVISQHGITEKIVLAYLAHYCSIDEAIFKKTNEYYQLCQIHEAQAEILAAIANENIAHNLKIYREKNHYPGFLYEDHFYCLSTIDTLWKLRKQLQDLYCC